MRNLAVAFCLGLFGLAGCGDSPPKVDTPVSYAPADDSVPGKSPGGSGPAIQVGPFEKKFEGLTLSVPAGWREVEPLPQQRGFIDARFLVPSRGNELQLTCSLIGGGIDSNIERWKGQFQIPAGEQPKTETLSVGHAEAKWIELHGTFSAGMLSREPAQENWRMIGVGIPLGERDFFLKLTGPSDSVAAVRDEFRTFVKSAKLSEQ